MVREEQLLAMQTLTAITFRHASSCANKTAGSKPPAPPDPNSKKAHRKKRRKYLSESALEEDESAKKMPNFIRP